MKQKRPRRPEVGRWRSDWTKLSRMKTVNLHTAKTHLSRLVDEVAAGEDVVIAKSGKPMVRLVPLTATARRTGFGSLKGKIRISGDFDAPLSDRLLRAFGTKR